MLHAKVRLSGLRRGDLDVRGMKVQEESSHFILFMKQVAESCRTNTLILLHQPNSIEVEAALAGMGGSGATEKVTHRQKKLQTTSSS